MHPILPRICASAVPAVRTLVRRLPLAAVALSLLLAPRAQAAGFELTTPGAKEAGRAGASVAGADNALGLFYNPATLLANTSRTDTAVAIHLGFTNICYRGTVVNEDMAGNRSNGGSLPEVCSSAKTSVIPATSSALRFDLGGQRFAVALGVYAPPAAGRNLSFGNRTTGMLSDGSLAASRYMLVQENILQIFPTLGLAWEPHKQFRVGASFGWGVTRFDFTTASYARTIVSQNPLVGATTDVSSRVKGLDGFVPRVQIGGWVQPLKDLPLEVGLNFTWVQQVKTHSADLQLRNMHTDYYSNPPGLLTLLGGLPQPDINAKLKGTSLSVPQPSSLTAGVRYAKKLAKPASKWGDRLATELFDVELDGLASFSHVLDNITVGLPNAMVVIPSPRPDLAPNSTLALPQKMVLQHHWRNQYALRVGGDYNIIPGKLAGRIGYSYENDAVSAGYHQLDFTPFQRHGLYVGATVRLYDLVDLSAAYAYFVIPNVTNTVDNAALRKVTSGMPQAGDNSIYNAGRITQTANTLIVEAAIHL